MKTRSLVYATFIFTGFFISLMMPISGVPLTSITCGFFIGVFGWKKIIMLRLFMVGLNMLFKPHATLFLFNMGLVMIPLAILGTMGVSLSIMIPVHNIVEKRILL